MRYWWVSQNKTYQHEAAGGYLWSPQSNSAGQRNAAYDFMREISPGDVVFSFAGRDIKAISIAESNAYESPKPQIFGRAGENWSDIGWKVDLFYVRLDNPVRPANHMHLLRPLLPGKYSPIRADGTGNQQYLFPVPEEMAQTLLQLCGNPELPDVSSLSQKLDALNITPADREIVSSPDIAETTKAQLVQARVGQGKFRSRVRAIEESCRVTGVSADSLLIASHIKPWKKSSNEERLDGNNGLFLSPHVDKLFDSHLISFSAKGRLLVSPLLDPDVLARWSIDEGAAYGRFNQSQEYFMEFHRNQLESGAGLLSG